MTACHLHTPMRILSLYAWVASFDNLDCRRINASVANQSHTSPCSQKLAGVSRSNGTRSGHPRGSSLQQQETSSVFICCSSPWDMLRIAEAGPRAMGVASGARRTTLRTWSSKQPCPAPCRDSASFVSLAALFGRQLAPPAVQGPTAFRPSCTDADRRPAKLQHFQRAGVFESSWDGTARSANGKIPPRGTVIRSKVLRGRDRDNAGRRSASRRPCGAWWALMCSTTPLLPSQTPWGRPKTRRYQSGNRLPQSFSSGKATSVPCIACAAQVGLLHCTLTPT